LTELAFELEKNPSLSDCLGLDPLLGLVSAAKLALEWRSWLLFWLAER